MARAERSLSLSQVLESRGADGTRAAAGALEAGGRASASRGLAADTARTRGNRKGQGRGAALTPDEGHF